MPRIVNVCIKIPDTSDGCFQCPLCRLVTRGGVMAYRCAMLDKKIVDRSIPLPGCADVAYACPVSHVEDSCPVTCDGCLFSHCIKEW